MIYLRVYHTHTHTRVRMLTPLSIIFQLYMAVSCIGRDNRGNRRNS